MDPTIFPDDLNGLSNEALSGLEAAAIAEFGTLDSDDASDETIARLAALADGTSRVRAELAAREPAASTPDLATLRSQMAPKAAPVEPVAASTAASTTAPAQV